MSQRVWKIFVALGLLLAAVPVLAVVAPPQPAFIRMPDGRTLRGTRYVSEDAVLVVDERGQLWRQSGTRWIEVASGAVSLRKTSGFFRRPLRGATALVALRLEFADQVGRVARDRHVAILFGETRSLRDYYASVSSGALGVAGEVFPEDEGWFQLGVPSRVYGADVGPGNSDPSRHDHGERTPEELVAAAVRVADPAVDFSHFDWDGDGAVDHLLIIHAGDDQAATGQAEDLWSRQVVLAQPLVVDGVRIESAMIVAESSPLGTFCHEFAHDLGAPDLYGASDVGPWGLMGAGCWNGDPAGSCPARLSAPLLWDLDGNPANGREGWISAQFAREGRFVSLQSEPVVLPAEVSGKVFLAEWRRREGYDAALPSEGVLVYAINSKTGATELLIPNRSGAEPKEASLRPGNQLLLPDGTGLRVVAPGQISLETAAEMTALERDDAPETAALQIFPNPFNASTRIQISADRRSHIRVFDLRGRLVVDLGVPPSAGYVRWDGRDARGRLVASGTYVVSVETPAGVFTRKITLLR